MAVAHVTVSNAVFELAPSAAEIVAVAFEPTLVVLTVNVADVLPAGIVRVAGTVASWELLPRVTTMPPVGAAPVRVTVPVDDLPPTTLEGLSVSVAMLGGDIVRLVVTETPFRVAVSLTDVEEATGVVFTVKVAVDLFAATVTEAGTVAELEPLDSFTTKPPVGARPLRVTVPVVDVPPATPAGLTLTDTKTGGVIVRAADAEDDPKVALIVAVT